MPPIPPVQIHTDDPINPNSSSPSDTQPPTAAKAAGITPQTAPANPPPTRTLPVSTPATSTRDPTAPPPPQPGARPVPAPTGKIPGDEGYTGPAAPQPAGLPRSVTATHTTIETRQAPPTEMPQQFNVPPPTDVQLAGRSTVPTTTSNQGPGPTTLNLGPAAPQQSPYQQEASGGGVNPPGYMQNPNPERFPGVMPREGQSGAGSGSGGILPGAGRAGGEGGGEGGGVGNTGSVGDAAWNLLSKAGDALKKTEEAAWKAATGKGGR